MNKERIENYINNFYGYGNLASQIWFIGIEEGSNTNSKEELYKRIEVWEELSSKHTVDCKEFHLKIKMGNEKPFTVGSIQATWGRYIDLIIQLTKNKKPEKIEKRTFQLNDLGRLNANHCMIELYPMPCRDRKSWSYSQLRDILPYLSSKIEYENFVSEFRVQNLKKLINQYKPQIVIFNSAGEKEGLIKYWNRIIGDNLKKINVQTKSGKGDFFFKIYKDNVKYYSLHNLKYEAIEVKNNIIDDFRSKQKDDFIEEWGKMGL